MPHRTSFTSNNNHQNAVIDLGVVFFSPFLYFTTHSTYLEECLVLDEDEELEALSDLDAAIAASLQEESATMTNQVDW